MSITLIPVIFMGHSAGWGPQSSSRSVAEDFSGEKTMLYGRYTVTLVHGVYKPTYS